jgi:hypothetical protein
LEACFVHAAQDGPSLGEIPLGQHQNHADAQVEGSPVVGQVQFADRAQLNRRAEFAAYCR